MKNIMASWWRTNTSTLRDWWASYCTALLRLAVALMAVAALVWLGYQFWRLLWGSSPIWPPSPSGAIDLKIYRRLVRRWFAGEPFYSEQELATQPPASYAILWLLLGWLEVTPARWLWAATTVVMLTWLIRVIVQESDAETPLERVFVALMPLSMYATGATIGNGQHAIHVVSLLVSGLLLLQRGRDTWREDLLTAALILVALVKPSVAAPFFWLVLFVSGRLRPALLVTLGYGAHTLFSASFQEPGLWVLLRGWLARAWRRSGRHA